MERHLPHTSVDIFCRIDNNRSLSSTRTTESLEHFFHRHQLLRSFIYTHMNRCGASFTLNSILRNFFYAVMNHRRASVTLMWIIEEPFSHWYESPRNFVYTDMNHWGAAFFFLHIYESLRSLFHIDTNHRGAPFMQMSIIEELLSHCDDSSRSFFHTNNITYYISLSTRNAIQLSPMPHNW